MGKYNKPNESFLCLLFFLSPYSRIQGIFIHFKSLVVMSHENHALASATGLPQSLIKRNVIPHTASFCSIRKPPRTWAGYLQKGKYLLPLPGPHTTSLSHPPPPFTDSVSHSEASHLPSSHVFHLHQGQCFSYTVFPQHPGKWSVN